MIGTRVRLRRNVERYPHFIAPEGATGTVSDYEEGSIAAVKLDGVLPGAEEWDNEVLWHDADFAHFDEDIEPLDAVRPTNGELHEVVRAHQEQALNDLLAVHGQPLVVTDETPEEQRRVVVLRALLSVNRIREQMDEEPLLDLPRGKVGLSGDCPLARALRTEAVIANVGGAVYLVVREEENSGERTKTEELRERVVSAIPYATASGADIMGIPGIADFVEAFDGEMLPRYDAERL